MPYGPNHPDSVRLRTAVRARIASRHLPRGCEGRLFAGYGEGAACAVCDRPIGATEVQYEVEFPNGTRMTFHLLCHAAWQLECDSNS